jgi:DNA-binding MarR family transcriptional regulator
MEVAREEQGYGESTARVAGKGRRFHCIRQRTIFSGEPNRGGVLRNAEELCRPGNGLQRNNTYTYHSIVQFKMTMADRKPRSTAAPPVDAPERRRLPPLLRRAWYSLNQAFRRRIVHLGITPDQFTALRTLLEGDPLGMSQRELAAAMSSDPNTVASLLRRMEEAGLVLRTPHESDRRVHRIQLRPNGRKKYEAARELAVTLQTEVLAVLPAAQREQFLANLAAVADRCRAAAGPSARPVSRGE